MPDALVTPERIMQFAWGFAPPLILEAALKHRVFDLLGSAPKTADGVAAETGASVRGLRAVSDFEYEMQMALMNRRLNQDVETVFMMPAEAYSYLSSRLVREIMHLGGNVSGLIPPLIEQRLREKLQGDPSAKIPKKTPGRKRK